MQVILRILQRIRLDDGVRLPGPAPLAVLMVIAVVGGLFLPATAPAHVPTLEWEQGFVDDAGNEGENRIGGPEKSRAIYGYLDGGLDRYAFSTAEAAVRTVRVIVPAYDEHATFYPALILEEDGVEVSRAGTSGGTERVAEFEPFSLTHFWEGAKIEYGFEPGHEYGVRIQPGRVGQQSGRYVLVIGGPEAFSGSDIAETFRRLPRIWLGAYGGAPIRFNPLVLIPIAFAAGVVGVLGYGIVSLAGRRQQASR